MPQNKPLVTIAMMTYNQEKYVRDSVRGMLAQTYEPLEIIISDDCSTDGTWDIINDEVDKYKQSGGSGGCHTIILNRNEQNMGIAAHAEKIIGMQHGVISVGNGGDDISLPNRVERIVEAWNSFGREVSLIIHSATMIDVNGRNLGPLDQRSVEHPLGAIFAYNHEKLKNAGFGKIVELGAYEDQIFARRAQMIGRVVSIGDKLLYYRVGSGVSSILGKRRSVEVRGAQARIASCLQTRHDIESVRGKVSAEILNEISASNERWIEFSQARLDLFSGKTLGERFRGFKGCCKGKRISLGTLLFAIYMLPKWISDPLMDTYTMIKNKIKFLKNGMMKIRGA